MCGYQHMVVGWAKRPISEIHAMLRRLRSMDAGQPLTPPHAHTHSHSRAHTSFPTHTHKRCCRLPIAHTVSGMIDAHKIDEISFYKVLRTDVASEAGVHTASLLFFRSLIRVASIIMKPHLLSKLIHQRVATYQCAYHDTRCSCAQQHQTRVETNS